MFHPDQDYYRCSTALIGCNILIILFELGITGIVLGVTIAGDSIARFLSESVSLWVFIPEILGTAFFFLWVYILISFLIDWAVTRNVLRRYFGKTLLLWTLSTVNAAIFVTGYIWIGLWFSQTQAW